MPKKNKKIASLSGSLLVQEGSDPDVGFVLRSLDDVNRKPTGRHSGGKPGRAESQESKPASDRPPLYAVAEEECHQTASGKHPASNHGSEAGTADKASGTSPDSSGHATKNVGPRDFLAALREGNLSKAESLFGHLTGLDSVRTKRVLYGPGGRNLVLACMALGMEQLQLVSILILTRKLGPSGTSLTPGQLTDLVSYFGDIDEATAKRVLNQWRTESIEVFGEQS